MARLRSPNYPAIGLPEAINMVRKLHTLQHKTAEPREVIARHLGYGGLNGQSNKVLSALLKYGLLEKEEHGGLRVSDLAINIIFPDGGGQFKAIEDAAFRSSLFSDIREHWPHNPPTDESLRNYLTRRQFAKSAIEDVIQNYRETIEFVTQESAAYADPSSTSPENPTVSVAQQSPPQAVAPLNFAITSDAIEVSARLTTAAEVDTLIQMLQINKVMITPVHGSLDTEYTDDEEGRQTHKGGIAR